MSDFINNGASELPDVKIDARGPTGATDEWAAGDANSVRQALLDLRSGLITEQASRIASDNSIIASGATPADVGAAPVTATGSTTARSVADRFADVVNVLDHGAVGDGSTDDTAAFTAAFSAGAGGNIYIPPGAYKISSPLYVSTGTKIFGSTDGYQHPAGTMSGTSLVWAGSATGTMLVFLDTQGCLFEGVNLVGTYTSGGSGCRAIAINSTPGAYANSQRNTFRNFALKGFYRGITLDDDTTSVVDWTTPLDYTDAGNTDGLIFEHITALNCYHGLVTNSVNVAYSVIRNSSFMGSGYGIYLKKCGWIKIDTCAGASWGTPVLGSSAFIAINENSGTVLVENCQAEGPAATAPSIYAFCLMSGSTKTAPTTFIGNQINSDFQITATQNALTFIGNQWNFSAYNSSNNSKILLINDVIAVGQSFTNSGTGTAFEQKSARQSSTWTPRLYQGTTEITTPTAASGYYIVDGSLCWFYGFFYKASGAPSAAGQWSIQGLPYNAVIPGTATLLSVPVTLGAFIVNAFDYGGWTPHRAEFSSGTNFKVDIFGQSQSLSWTTDYVLISISGVIPVA